MSKQSSNSGGIGLCGLLTIVFITLKLTGFIAWSWWWVLAPIWAPTAIVLAVVVVPLLVAAIIGLFALAAALVIKD